MRPARSSCGVAVCSRQLTIDEDGLGIDDLRKERAVEDVQLHEAAAVECNLFLVGMVEDLHEKSRDVLCPIFVGQNLLTAIVAELSY